MAHKPLLFTRADRSADFLAGPQKRAAVVEKIDKENRTIELAFSSDVELERWPGIAEKLSHAPGACDLSRLNDSAPLLFNHDFDRQLGVIESARIDKDWKGRAVVRFGKGPLAEEKWADVRDGILKGVSVGYRIKEVKLTAEKEGLDVYTVERWQPYEISFVTVPADTSCGAGRSETSNTTRNFQIMNRTEMLAALRERGFTVADNISDTDLKRMFTEGLRAQAQTPAAPAQTTPVVQVNETRAAGEASELERVTAILACSRSFDNNSQQELAEQYIREKRSVSDFKGALVAVINKRNEGLRNAGDVGLSKKEVKAYSFVRAINLLVNPTDKRAQQDAAFELEVSNAAAARRGSSARGLIVPADVLQSNVYGERAGAISIKTGGGFSGTGANTVQTTLLTGSFVDILRNRCVLMNLGTHLDGLVGDVSIPKKISGSTGFWLGEHDDATQTSFDFGQFTMSPKTVGAYADVTRKMLQQSSMGIEALTRSDIIDGLALTIDTAGWYGTGLNNQPTGLKNRAGINAKTFAAANPTYVELVDMETKIATGNADVSSMHYVSNAAFRGYAKTALEFAGIPGKIWQQGGTVNGYNCEITNQISAGDIFFGNFADQLIATWGGLDLTVDTSALALKGGVRVIAFQDVDMNIRRAESFCYGTKP